MGKTAKWFRGLLGGGGGSKKDSSTSTSSSASSKPRNTKKWTFVGSYRDKHPQPPPRPPPAAAETKSTAIGRHPHDGEAAAVKIQSLFRGYLARRALKALRGVVKLQALVRGHITRKKKAEEMRCLQALLRLQSKARANRIQSSEMQHSNSKPPLFQQYGPGPVTPEKHERTLRSKSARNNRSSPLKRNSSVSTNRDSFDWDQTQLRNDFLDRRIDGHTWDYYCRETRMKYGLMDDNKSAKIVEIDRNKPKHQNVSHVAFDRLSLMDSHSKDSTTARLSSSSVSSGEVQSRDNRRPKALFPEEDTFCTSATSLHSSSKRGPFTPTASDCSRSFQSACSDHPNYMSNTESSRAKARSQSAPKQRLELEKSSSARRHGSHGGSGDMRRNMLKASALQSSFTGKAYPGSGRLDRLGAATHHEFCDEYDNRY